MLTAAVTTILWAFWGRPAIVPGVVFGALAAIIQFAAVVIVRPVWSAPFDRFLGRWGVGMALRVAGIGVFLAAVLLDRELFPPVPSAFAYLGVLIPLLFMELRFLK
ncbi:MAG: hypothetical protein IID05_08070 [Gemmatimonadetes bacterium]|nr:hypothetical protein [Gemmatimonadota bacterium]